MSVVMPPAETGTVLMPVIKVDGSAIPTAHLDALLDVRVQVAVRTIGRCTLRFDDADYAIAGAHRYTVGKQVVVEARGSGNQDRQSTVFTGAITSVGLEQREGRAPELVVIAEDAAYELSRTSAATTYLDQTYADIVGTVLKSTGTRAEVRSTPARHAYVLQTDTHLGFIDEIGRRLGWDWVVDHTGTFHFWDSWAGGGRTGTIGDPVTLRVGESLAEFSVRVSADAPQEVAVRGWDHVEKAPVTAVATGKITSVPRRLRDVTGLSGAKPARQLDARTGPTDRQEATSMAQVRARGAGNVLVRGRCWSTPTLRPGVLVTLDGAGPASGDYFVQEVTHVLRPEGLRTEFVAGDRERLVAPAGGGHDDDRPSFAHTGLVVGTVTDLNDPDQLGRVKVLYSGLSDEVTSHWARVATIGGGPTRGAVFMPVVGDEVLVGFEGGDARRAVVLGGLYGKKDKVPGGSVVDGKVENRRITSELGHVIELGDGTEPAKQHILLALQDTRHRVRLGKDAAVVEVPADVPLTISSGSSTIAMDGKGGLTLDADKITIKAKQGVTVEGMDVTVKAKGKLAATGTNAEVKATANLAVEGGAVTTVKGGMVQIN